MRLALHAVARKNHRQYTKQQEVALSQIRITLKYLQKLYKNLQKRIITFNNNGKLFRVIAATKMTPKSYLYTWTGEKLARYRSIFVEKKENNRSTENFKAYRQLQNLRIHR